MSAGEEVAQGEQEGPQEDGPGAHPVVQGKGVLEVKDGYHQTQELPQCDHQGHCEGGTVG